jgi:hypothetical protein
MEEKKEMTYDDIDKDKRIQDLDDKEIEIIANKAREEIAASKK